MKQRDVLSELKSATRSLLKSPIHHCKASLVRTNYKKHLLSATIAGATVLASPLALSQNNSDWNITTALLYYTEEGRVTAIEPNIAAYKQFENDKKLSLLFSYDTLSGSSPTGAVPTSKVDTFSRPSGGNTFVVEAGEFPLDDTFQDTRVALSANWAQPLKNNLLGNIGSGFSNEHDYFSFNVNGGITREYNKKTTSVSLNIALAFDTISPVGGVPIFGSCLLNTSTNYGCTETSVEQTRSAKSKSKQVADLVLSFSHILSPTTLLQSSLSISSSDGYQTDPYKVISIIDSDNSFGTGVGFIERNVYEKRPEQRTKQAFFARVKSWFFEGRVLDAHYRYLTDDWGLKSSTVDLALRIPYPDYFVQPKIRYYRQNAIDHYATYLVDVDVTELPAFYTADQRQGQYVAMTLGIEFGVQLKNDREIKVSLERYKQVFSVPRSNIGQLSDQNLAPDLEAIIMRIYYDL